jgi:hypothetical protein
VDRREILYGSSPGGLENTMGDQHRRRGTATAKTMRARRYTGLYRAVTTETQHPEKTRKLDTCADSHREDWTEGIPIPVRGPRSDITEIPADVVRIIELHAVTCTYILSYRHSGLSFSRAAQQAFDNI